MKKLIFLSILLLTAFGCFFSATSYAFAERLFTSAVDYSVGLTSWNINTGQFNNDDFADIAVVNMQSNNISILLGVGDGTFYPAVNYSVGAEPRFVTTGLFNNDAYPDLAVANWGGNNISILLGVGDGTFLDQNTYTAGGTSGPSSITTGLFNNDAYLDLAVANFNNSVSILLGVGDGTFSPAVDYAAGTNPQSITAGLFNNDAFLDLAVAHWNHSNVSILLGVGDGTFSAAVNYNVGSPSFSITTGLFNNDAFLDLVVANASVGSVSVLLGVGDGTFSPAVNYAVGNGASSVTTGQFNDDDYLDLAVANSGDDGTNVSILLGVGDGTFSSAIDYSTGPSVFSITTGDFNNDASLDLAVTNNRKISVLLGGLTLSHSGNFSEPFDVDDGSVEGSREVFIANDTFVNPGGTLTEGVHYILTNKPVGLTAVMIVDGAGETATLTFTGNATNHTSENSITNLTITFLDGAFADTANALDVNNYLNDSGVVNFYTNGDADFIVNSLLDDGDDTCTEEYCTFRDAIASATDGNIIGFGDLEGTIVLDVSNTIEINHNISILGPGADILSIDFNDDSNNYIEFENDGEVNILGLTFTNASGYLFYQDSDGGTYNISDSIFTNNSEYEPVYAYHGNWNFNNVTFSNNLSDSDYAGAIYFEGDGNTLNITNSSFYNNTSAGYGTIYVYDDAIVNITNSTFANNNDDGSDSSGIYSEADEVNITNSTFYNNISSTATLYNNGDEMNIVNSIIYGNNNCDGDITSLGHNIDSGDTCGFEEEGDQSDFPTSYNKLFDFDGTSNGGNPSGSLIESSGKLYGMTYSGGGGGSEGTIFEYDPTNVGSEYSVIHDFDGDNGSSPQGSLIEISGKFYGLATQGGGDNYGFIFEYNPDSIGSEYSVLYDFDDTTGSFPYGSLLESDNKFYGMTSDGGTNSEGTIFEYDPTNVGSEYSVIHDFDGDNGSSPYGSLIASDGKFYGTTYQGGAGGYGVIFEYNPSNVGSEYLVIHEFDDDRGSYPYGSLIESNSKFYGMTGDGGENSDGVIFEYNPDSIGSEYSVLYDFDDTTGSFPYGSLLESDNKFYGMTNSGGADDYGIIFEYDPEEDVYTILHGFNGADGSYPYYGSLLENNGKLYGMTNGGGDNNYGVIFSYDLLNNPLGLDLDGLKDNGGPVQTIALAEGSIAIDAGDDDSAPETDARGYGRNVISDIGAFEYNGIGPEETCSDGIQNQDETSIDEGGVCEPEEEEETPRSSSGSSPSRRTIPNIPIVPTTPPTDCLPGYLFSPTTGQFCFSNTIPIIPPTPPPSSGPSAPPTPPVFLSSYNLKFGITSPDIKELQIYLNTHNFPVSLTGPGSLGLETNFFGPKTKAAVILFQKAHNLIPDGIVGPKTKGAMI